MSWQPFSWNKIVWQPRFRPALDRTAATSQEALRLVATFLTPVSVIAGVLGVWRLSSDLGWTDEFFIARGIFSHWQVWFALAAFAQTTAVSLNRTLKARPAAKSN